MFFPVIVSFARPAWLFAPGSHCLPSSAGLGLAGAGMGDVQRKPLQEMARGRWCPELPSVPALLGVGVCWA